MARLHSLLENSFIRGGRPGIHPGISSAESAPALAVLGMLSWASVSTLPSAGKMNGLFSPAKGSHRKMRAFLLTAFLLHPFFSASSRNPQKCQKVPI
jgi:hypothetical protein